MLLVVDVGNTQTHFGVFRDGEEQVAESWRFATVRESTGDELGAALSNLLALRGLSPSEITDSIVSSTVPQLAPEWSDMATRYLGHEMLVVGPGIRTGMAIRYDNPREIGADRLVNAVAAYEKVKGAVVVVDVGNTQTHFGTYDGTDLAQHWRFATVRESTADQLGAALRNLLELRGYSFGELEGSIVSSTVPQLEPEWTTMVSRYLGHEMLVVGPGTKTGLPIRYDNPREIGADRLVNAVAIRERFGGPAVCVDFGTATTFDVLSGAGEYVGGAIMTGIEISLEALTERGARLPKVDLAPPKSVIGKNTIDAIRSGVVYGYAGAIDAILRRLYEELGQDADVVATGGLSGLVVPYTEEIDEVDDLLTLTGLRLLYERNL